MKQFSVTTAEDTRSQEAAAALVCQWEGTENMLWCESCLVNSVPLQAAAVPVF